jgi:transcriptional regulator with XRE-family HTH domain
METFGAVMRALMAERDLSLRKLAVIVHYNDGYLSRVSRDLRVPSAEVARRLDDTLGAGGQLSALAQAAQDSAGRTASLDAETGQREQDEDEMQRRRLLQALAALGVTSTPTFEALGEIRTGVDRALGRDSASHLAEWEETVAEYGYAYIQLPPHLLVRDLAADLVAVQQINARIPDTERLASSWRRVTGGLAALMAKTLCNLGQPRAAREWWTTAQHAADTSRDADLSLWIHGERLINGLYEHRPAAVLLRRADQAAASPRGTRSRGMLHLLTARAQLLATMGAADRADDDLRAGGRIFSVLPASVAGEVRSVHGWAEDRLRYSEAWVHAHTGRRAQLDEAVARARQIVPDDDPRAVAQLGLLRAYGHVRAGDTTEGVKHAHSIFAAQPSEQRTTMVTSLAGQVLQAVPERSLGEPAVAGYRELLASGPRKEIM